MGLSVPLIYPNPAAGVNSMEAQLSADKRLGESVTQLIWDRSSTKEPLYVLCWTNNPSSPSSRFSETLKARAWNESKNSANICEPFPSGFSVSNRFQLMDIPSKIGFLRICNPDWIFFYETYLTVSFSQMLQATMYCGKGCSHQLPTL